MAMAISTHTLTWSVTNAVSVPGGQSNISTHTLTWSVTYAFENALDSVKISTHTLTWSVTEAVNIPELPLSYFNSHAHVERDT